MESQYIVYQPPDNQQVKYSTCVFEMYVTLEGKVKKMLTRGLTVDQIGFKLTK